MATPRPLMTAARLAELRAELDQLNARERGELAEQLRDARVYGDGSNNDEYHAAREEQMILEARVALLRDTIDSAAVIDPSDTSAGVAVIGSTITVEDVDSGAQGRYRLASAHEALTGNVISAASPLGQALIGHTPGTVVTVELPKGRSRTVRLVSTDAPALAPS